MKKIKSIPVILFLLLGLHSLKAQSIEEIITVFFENYKANPTKAVEYIFSTNQWMIDKKQDAINNVKSQMENSIDLIGDYINYELITQKKIGGSYKLVSYMVKHDRQPLRFTFVFYMPRNVWQVQNFQFDDNLDEELEEAAKIYRLKEN